MTTHSNSGTSGSRTLLCRRKPGWLTAWTCALALLTGCAAPTAGRPLSELIVDDAPSMGPTSRAETSPEPPRQAEPETPSADAAVAAFEKRRDDALFAAAQSHCEQGDLETGGKLLKRLVDRNPEYPRAMVMLAEVRIALGDADASEQLLRRRLAKHPEDAEAHHALGLLLEILERPREAVSALRRAVELAPQDPVYRASYEDLRDAAPPVDSLAPPPSVTR